MAFGTTILQDHRYNSKLNRKKCIVSKKNNDLNLEISFFFLKSQAMNIFLKMNDFEIVNYDLKLWTRSNLFEV
jgi:hypothetical protein